MNDKFTIVDVTDEIIIGGFGNLEGNLGLLKYNKEDIRKMITENNNGNDNIRLINSLLQSLKELQEQLQQKEDIINSIKEYCNREKVYYEKNRTKYQNEYIDMYCILELIDNKG